MDGISKLDYTERLKQLNLPSLAYRRLRGDMIETYKYHHKYDKQILASSFQPRQRASRKHDFQMMVLEQYSSTRFTAVSSKLGITYREKLLTPLM